MSADEELGYIYMPVSSPSHDYYGGEREGDNLFGESLVCLDAATGERIWHFQITHHGLWDYDPPTASLLIDIEVDGKPIKAVVQLSKMGFCFVFDRATGEPVWPIVETAVPQSTVPGEHSSPTQPFPTKPAPYDQQGMLEHDVIDLTPELRQEALEILRQYDPSPLYTPPSQQRRTLEGARLQRHTVRVRAAAGRLPAPPPGGRSDSCAATAKRARIDQRAAGRRSQSQCGDAGFSLRVGARYG